MGLGDYEDFALEARVPELDLSMDLAARLTKNI